MLKIGTIMSAVSKYFKYGIDTPMFYTGERVIVKQRPVVSLKTKEYHDNITSIDKVNNYYVYRISSYPKLTFYEIKDDGGKKLIPVCDEYYSVVPYYISVHKQEEL